MPCSKISRSLCNAVVETQILLRLLSMLVFSSGKKKRQTEEEVGRQHQGMDRPAVCQVPEGSGEQRKMEEIDCEIVCGAQTTLPVKG